MRLGCDSSLNENPMNREAWCAAVRGVSKSRAQLRDHSLSASLSESVIRLISNCRQVEECLLSRANCISQPVDVHLLSPAISAYSAARSVPVSRLRSTCQPVDQHL